MLTFHFSYADGKMTVPETLTSGMVGQRVKFVFSSEWNNLQKTAIFRAGAVTRIVTDIEDEAVIPAEVLEIPLRQLYVGVYGISADGSVVIPTVRAEGPQILPGVDPSADPGTDPTLPVWAQLQTEILNTNERITDNTKNTVSAISEIKAMVDDMSYEVVTDEKAQSVSFASTPGKYDIGTQTVQFVNDPNSIFADLACTAGEIYTISGRWTVYHVGVIFLDAAGNIVSTAHANTATEVVSEYKVVIPDGCTRMIVNASVAYPLSIQKIIQKGIRKVKTGIDGAIVVSKGGGGDHTSINEAVQAASDGATILIMPGTYEEQVEAWGKTVHLIGMNRETCILVDHSSHYATPPLEIGSGSVQNMTIIEDHAAPDNSLLSGDDVDGCSWDYERAYAIHVEDYTAEGKNLLIANCKICNTKRAALGMGTYAGQHITIRNCEIWSGVPTRTADVKRGAVYFHNYSLSGVQNAADQRITLIHNDISCDDEMAMCILDAHMDGIHSQLTVDAIQNCIYSAVNGMDNAVVQLKSGALSNDYVKLSGKSYGNSVAILNT